MKAPNPPKTLICQRLGRKRGARHGVVPLTADSSFAQVNGASLPAGLRMGGYSQPPPPPMASHWGMPLLYHPMYTQQPAVQQVVAPMVDSEEAEVLEKKVEFLEESLEAVEAKLTRQSASVEHAVMRLSEQLHRNDDTVRAAESSAGFFSDCLAAYNATTVALNKMICKILTFQHNPAMIEPLSLMLFKDLLWPGLEPLGASKESTPKRAASHDCGLAKRD
jgi:hypothetical protein